MNFLDGLPVTLYNALASFGFILNYLLMCLLIFK